MDFNDTLSNLFSSELIRKLSEATKYQIKYFLNPEIEQYVQKSGGKLEIVQLKEVIDQEPVGFLYQQLLKAMVLVQFNTPVFNGDKEDIEKYNNLPILWFNYFDIALKGARLRIKDFVKEQTGEEIEVEERPLSEAFKEMVERKSQLPSSPSSVEEQLILYLREYPDLDKDK